MVGRKILKIIIAVVVIGVSGVYLFYKAAESSWQYYYSVDQFVESPLYKMSNNRDGSFNQVNMIRLAGVVKKGSIVRAVVKNQLDFELAGSKSCVKVRFYGIEPKNFAAGKEVVVEGRTADGVFAADKIFTRCESKYKSKLKRESEPAGTDTNDG